MKKEKKKSDYRGVFYYMDADGRPSDAGIVDELLVNDYGITKELERLGVIKVLRLKPPDKK